MLGQLAVEQCIWLFGERNKPEALLKAKIGTQNGTSDTRLSVPRSRRILQISLPNSLRCSGDVA